MNLVFTPSFITKSPANKVIKADVLSVSISNTSAKATLTLGKNDKFPAVLVSATSLLR